MLRVKKIKGKSWKQNSHGDWRGHSKTNSLDSTSTLKSAYYEEQAQSCARLLLWNTSYSSFFFVSVTLISHRGQRYAGCRLLGFHIWGCPRTALCIFHLLRKGATSPHLLFSVLFVLLHFWKPLFGYGSFNVLVSVLCLWFFILTSLMFWEEKAA